MKRDALRLERPVALQAHGPPERDGRARDDVRLLVTTARGHEHARFRDLARFLERGSLLVVNDSTTLPASLPARHARLGRLVVNVATRYGTTLHVVEPRWSPLDTAPLPLQTGDRLEIAGLAATLVAPHPGAAHLWFVRIAGSLDAAMARAGVPVRDDHLEPPYPSIEAYQTIFARHPGSAEMPSAARPFTARTMDDLKRGDIELTTVTLHADVSGPGVETDRIEDHVVPAEPFDVPRATAEAVNRARRDGRPVIAVGTTVVRALESAWDGERVRPAAGFTRLLVPGPCGENRGRDHHGVPRRLYEPSRDAVRHRPRGAGAGRVRRGGARGIPVARVRGQPPHCRRSVGTQRAS